MNTSNPSPTGKNRPTRMPSRHPVVQELKSHHPLYLMMLPGAVLVFLFSYLPMAGVLFAFKKMRFYGNILESFQKSDWIGLKNFQHLFRGRDAWIATRNTVLYNLAFIVLGLVLAVGLAIALNELRNKRAAKLYQTAFILPHFLSWIIVSYFVYSFLSTERGFVNRMLLIPLGMEPINWYFEPQYWPPILLLLNIWKSLGFNAIVYLAAIAGIDPEYYDAAQIDGASKARQIRHITLPLLTPLMAILTILAIGRIFNSDFGLFYTVPLAIGRLRPATEVIDTLVYKIMQKGDYGVASASGLYQSTVGFILILAANAGARRIDSSYSLF